MMYPWSCFFGHDPHLMSEDGTKDRLVNWKCRLSAWLLQHHFRPIQSLHNCGYYTGLNMTKRYLNCFTWGRIDFQPVEGALPFSDWGQCSQIWKCWFSFQTIRARLWNTWVKVEDCSLMKTYLLWGPNADIRQGLNSPYQGWGTSYSEPQNTKVEQIILTWGLHWFK